MVGIHFVPMLYCSLLEADVREQYGQDAGLLP